MNVLISIKKTIKYGHRFGGQLTEQQLFERLIGGKIYKKAEIKKAIQKSLEIKKKLFSPKQNKIEKEKIEKTKVLANKLALNFKDILFLGITGSVAAGYPKKNDDIDILIITKINKLWITRLKLRLFITMNKIPHRKFGRQEKKDEFCFNLWLDEKGLLLPKEKQDLKSAMDLILMKAIISRNKSYEKFIAANAWAKEYVATGYSNLSPRPPIADRLNQNKENAWEQFINGLMFWPQFWYMKKRIRNEKIGLHKAFFHH